MNRPTIADLANAAGVSVSTVNRLLHGTGALRPQTADLILSAAQQIGFRSSGPLHERRRDNLPHRHLSFLMQQSHRPLCRIWAEALLGACARRTDAVIEPDVLFEDDPSPEAVAANLLKIGGSADAIAVISADHPLVGQAIDELRVKGVPVIAYVTDLSAATSGPRHARD
ncbi:LacI family DNA-binding transcriptional regulator [Mesorhizobium caraganae]